MLYMMEEIAAGPSAGVVVENLPSWEGWIKDKQLIRSREMEPIVVLVWAREPGAKMKGRWELVRGGREIAEGSTPQLPVTAGRLFLAPVPAASLWRSGSGAGFIVGLADAAAITRDNIGEKVDLQVAATAL